MEMRLPTAFNHADARLKPKVMPPVIRRWPFAKTYLVTPEAFPELHARFTELATIADAQDFRLVMVDAKPGQMPPAVVSYKRREVALNMLSLATYDYDGVLSFLVGHELGHVWLLSHPQADSLRIRVNEVLPSQRAEVSADIMGRCFTENPEAIVRSLAKLNATTEPGATKLYPTPETRILAIESVWPGDCPDLPQVPSYKNIGERILAATPQ